MFLEIMIKGYVQPHWFEALEMRQEADYITTLRGEFEDQAALYGVLNRIQNLGMVLISVNPVEEEEIL